MNSESVDTMMSSVFRAANLERAALNARISVGQTTEGLVNMPQGGEKSSGLTSEVHAAWSVTETDTIFSHLRIEDEGNAGKRVSVVLKSDAILQQYCFESGESTTYYLPLKSSFLISSNSPSRTAVPAKELTHVSSYTHTSGYVRSRLLDHGHFD